MFKQLDELSATITWPVTSNQAANRGKITQVKFFAEFRRPDDDRLQEIVDITNDARPKTDKLLLEEVLVSVGEEESGQYTAGSEAEQSRLLKAVGVKKAIVQAFFVAMSGEKAKN